MVWTVPAEAFAPLAEAPTAPFCGISVWFWLQSNHNQTEIFAFWALFGGGRRGTSLGSLELALLGSAQLG